MTPDGCLLYLRQNPPLWPPETAGGTLPRGTGSVVASAVSCRQHQPLSAGSPSHPQRCLRADWVAVVLAIGVALCTVSGCADWPMKNGAAPGIGETQKGVMTPPSLKAVADADTAYAAGRYAEAAEAFQGLAQGSPRNAYFWFRLGSCQLHLRQHAQALAALEQAVALDPHEGRFAYNLAMAHSAVARDAFAQARAQLPPGSPWRPAAQQHQLLLEAVVGTP